MGYGKPKPNLAARAYGIPQPILPAISEHFWMLSSLPTMFIDRLGCRPKHSFKHLEKVSIMS
jgi:hypothetical protein